MSKAYSFGTIFSNRGSVRLTMPLISMDANTANTRIVFSTCTTKNLAIISIPLEPNTVHNIDVRLRYSSDVITDQDFTEPVQLSGTLLLTYEINSRIVLTRPSMDISLRGQWQNAFADWTSSSQVQGILESIKLNTFLDDFVDSLRKEFDGKSLQTLIRRADAKTYCSLPSFEPMECTASTRTIPSACHPCDKCCNCMVRQTCGGECSDCPCVNCEKTPYLYFISALLFLCSFLILRAFYY